MRKIEINYFCDFCEKKIGDKPHICIVIDRYASVVKPPEWKHLKKLKSRPYQFCDIDHCLTRFLLTNSKKTKTNNK
jgi:hypothetical protein